MWQMYNGQMVDVPTYTPQAPRTNTNIIRVYGIDGARNLQLPPNSDVVAFDNDIDVLYRISVDGTGKRDIVTMDLSAHAEQAKPDLSKLQSDLAETRNELAKLKDEFVRWQKNEQLD